MQGFMNQDHKNLAFSMLRLQGFKFNYMPDPIKSKKFLSQNSLFRLTSEKFQRSRYFLTIEKHYQQPKRMGRRLRHIFCYRAGLIRSYA